MQCARTQSPIKRAVINWNKSSEMEKWAYTSAERDIKIENFLSPRRHYLYTIWYYPRTAHSHIHTNTHPEKATSISPGLWMMVGMVIVGKRKRERTLLVCVDIHLVGSEDAGCGAEWVPSRTTIRLKTTAAAHIHTHIYTHTLNVTFYIYFYVWRADVKSARQVQQTTTTIHWPRSRKFLVLFKSFSIWLWLGVAAYTHV
jgi:hypothetical protein